jgi:hypothetical protein
MSICQDVFLKPLDSKAIIKVWVIIILLHIKIEQIQNEQFWKKKIKINPISFYIVVCLNVECVLWMCSMSWDGWVGVGVGGWRVAPIKQDDYQSSCPATHFLQGGITKLNW